MCGYLAQEDKTNWSLEATICICLSLFLLKNYNLCRYYESLKANEMKYPNPSFAQIELDLRRTFQDET